MAQHYDRKAEDLGNITGLERVNLRSRRAQGTLFYIQRARLTRDPYMNTGLPQHVDDVREEPVPPADRRPLVCAARWAAIVPDRDALLKRLDGVKKQLAGTRFKVVPNNDYVTVTCPWGNRFNMHSPDVERFGARNRSRHALSRIRRADGDCQGDRAFLQKDLRRQSGSTATAPKTTRSMSAITRTCCSARPTSRSRPMTGITSRSMSRISRAPTPKRADKARIDDRGEHNDSSDSGGINAPDVPFGALGLLRLDLDAEQGLRLVARARSDRRSGVRDERVAAVDAGGDHVGRSGDRVDRPYQPVHPWSDRRPRDFEQLAHGRPMSEELVLVIPRVREDARLRQHSQRPVHYGNLLRDRLQRLVRPPHVHAVCFPVRGLVCACQQ